MRVLRAILRAIGALVELLARCFLRAILIAACIYVLMFVGSASAMFRNGFESGSEGGPPPDSCADTNPAGWQGVYKSWSQVFSSPDGNPSAAYPGSVAFPTPIGADIGTATIIAFVPFGNQGVLLYWDKVQARPQDGYFKARPADGMLVAITPCEVTVNGTQFGAVDLRAPDPFSPDVFAQPRCRIFEANAALAWTTGNDPAACPLVAGRTYYLILAPINPATLQHSCQDLPTPVFGCDVGAVTQSSTTGQ